MCSIVSLSPSLVLTSFMLPKARVSHLLKTYQFLDCTASGPQRYMQKLRSVWAEDISPSCENPCSLGPHQHHTHSRVHAYAHILENGKCQIHQQPNWMLKKKKKNWKPESNTIQLKKGKYCQGPFERLKVFSWTQARSIPGFDNTKIWENNDPFKYSNNQSSSLWTSPTNCRWNLKS